MDKHFGKSKQSHSYMSATLLVSLLVWSSSIVWSNNALAAQEETDARTWLSKMAVALHEQNYEGTFTYMRGGEFNAMQIAHRFQDGKEFERLLQLNGEKLELMRVNEEIICHHENSDHVDLGHHVPMGPFSSAFSENLAAYQDFYRFALHGEGRIAGRAAIKLAISPKFNDRYGYRLWLDKETGLLLQSHLIDVDKKRVREIFQFSSIELGENVADDVLLSSLGNDAIAHRLTGEVVSHPKENISKPQWRVAWVPDGFRSIQVPGSDRLHFTDGLATFSIFIERAANGVPNKEIQGPLTTQVGGTVIISRPMKGSPGQITVVGEVPITTARRVAESVEPVIY